MTKKRFIKLLMSYGIQRNNAHRIARDVNGRNIPYKKAFPAVIASYKSSLCILELGRAFRELVEHIKSVVIPAWDKFKEAFYSASCYSSRNSLPCPDYGQTPKTITKPYIKQITKSRSRERKQ